MKALLKIAKILCYLCGFPIFMVCAIIASQTNIAAGKSYGLGAYSGVIVAVLFTLIWFVIVLVMEIKFKKNPPKNRRKKIKKQTATMAICAVLLTGGLMFVLDAALPSIFPGLTSSTIYYEDIAEDDANANKSNLHKELLDTIVGRSVLAGLIGAEQNDGSVKLAYYSPYKTTEAYGTYTGLPIDKDNNPLKMSKYGYWVKANTYNVGEYEGTQDGEPSKPVAKSSQEMETMVAYFDSVIKTLCAEGFKNEQVKSLIARDSEYCQYLSLNLSGYESWAGPWVDLANANRMTIPVVVNLIIGQRKSIVSNPDNRGGPLANPDGTRQVQDDLHKLPVYNPETGKVEMIEVGWTVLDMMGDYSADPFSPVPALGLNLVGDEGLWTMLKTIELAGTTIGDLLGETTIDGLLESGTEDTLILGAVVDIPSIYGLVDSLLSSVSAAVGNPAIAGTPTTGSDTNWKLGYGTLILKLQNSDNTSGVTVQRGDDLYYYANVGDAASGLGIYPNNAGRGTIDYMRQSWVDSNGLLFIIYGLFALRKTCYIFAGINVLLAVIIGAIRMKLNDYEIQSIPVTVPYASDDSLTVDADQSTLPAVQGFDYADGSEYVQPMYEEEAPAYFGTVDNN